MHNQTFLLTGHEVSNEMKQVLSELEEGKYVSIERIEATKEIQLARTCISNSVSTHLLAGREELRLSIIEKLMSRGSFSGIDKNGHEEYNNDVHKNARLDIIIGLPASGKSSTIVNIISKEFHSRIIDNDEAKKMLPEFNNGWGAGVVHKESKVIGDYMLFSALKQHDNIVLPKVGGSYKKMNEVVKIAKSQGYEVSVHMVEIERQKALGRMLNRFLEEGRFLDPKIIDKYNNEIDGDTVTKTYNLLKEGGMLDGYSKWSNEVGKNEKPIFIEGKGEAEFIRNARIAKDIMYISGNDGGDRRSRVSASEINKRESGRMEHTKPRCIYKEGVGDIPGTGFKRDSALEKLYAYQKNMTHSIENKKENKKIILKKENGREK